ncbi:MAG: hypothetical protein U0641_00540 [Anaerolineae bacterium]
MAKRLPTEYVEASYWQNYLDTVYRIVVPVCYTIRSENGNPKINQIHNMRRDWVSKYVTQLPIIQAHMKKALSTRVMIPNIHGCDGVDVAEFECVLWTKHLNLRTNLVLAGLEQVVIQSCYIPQTRLPRQPQLAHVTTLGQLNCQHHCISLDIRAGKI